MAAPRIAGFWRSDLEMTDLSSHVCVVTGANRGIGYAVARGLAAQGAAVAVVCRTEDKADAACRSLTAETDNDDVHPFGAELSSQAEIRRVAAEIAARFPTVQLLINNAGVLLWNRTDTVDGIEATFATNHLAPFLLTHLLLDAVKAGAPSRVVTVASVAHRRAHIAFDDLEGSRRYSGIGAYAQSKLANILFARELALRLEGAGVVSHAVHPGLVATGIWKANWFLRMIAPVLSRTMRRPTKGAVSTLYAATSPAAGAVTGRYYVDRREAATSAEANDRAVARRLWDVSERLTGLSLPVPAHAGGS